MKKVTKNNLIKLVDLKKQYLESGDICLLDEINIYIDEVINKDKRYYAKLASYGFDKEMLEYLM